MLNNSSNLYKAEWLDLVFKGRNKNYGAYLLRAESGNIQMKALWIASALFISSFVVPMIYQKLKPHEVVAIFDQGPVEIAPLPPPIDLPLKKEEEPAAAKAEAPKEKLKMVKIPSKVVVVEHTTAEPPMLKDLDNAIVGPVTQEGKETNLQSLPITGDGNGAVGTGTGNGTTVDNTIYNSSGVEVYPEFDGGMKAWAKFIQRNLRYPYQAQEKGVQGKVLISFVVERDGSVSNVTVVNGIGAGCDEEAARVIAKSPKWKPGRQNDQAVRVRYTIPIGFAMPQ
ncbi:TonB [Pedobacter sp. BAL39]|uniref:energy transducer TonB n=1 Tax=Pedobacter sp. BAL39 TaxID=391596 RepID=UPI000155930D|nr:energy transducer TonB [Pedobacter sp. BAL39]EDM36129.1 TonB [Pedobacter sp. BAL39]